VRHSGSGILTREDFRREIPGFPHIIGATINLSIVFNILKINDWLVSIFSPFIAHFSGNIYLLILVQALVTYAVRIVIVSQMAYISIFMVFLVPLAVKAGSIPDSRLHHLRYGQQLDTVLPESVYLTAYYAPTATLLNIPIPSPWSDLHVHRHPRLFACVPLWQWLDCRCKTGELLLSLLRTTPFWYMYSAPIFHKFIYPACCATQIDFR
jgi:DASS family divalent anion:Na+ symporter